MGEGASLTHILYFTDRHVSDVATRTLRWDVLGRQGPSGSTVPCGLSYSGFDCSSS